MNGSRRESRSSLGNKQNDALFEFETFKKKFLLANKHIAKLNSTLSVRVEELNAQISMLYVENLRLRASEIALASQLKREREQSRKILIEAEAASQKLTKHLSYLRETLYEKDEPTAPPTPPSPKARRPPPPVIVNPDPLFPQFRIARPPTIPGIHEDEEPSIEEPESTTTTTTTTATITMTTAAPPSRSKLPLPAARSSSPAPTLPLTEETRLDLVNIVDRRPSKSLPRKTIRRQSAMAATAPGVKKSKSRSALQPIDNIVEEANDPEKKSTTTTTTTTTTTQRQFLRPPSPPRDSPSPTLFDQAEGIGGGGGREKRVRKSVNYAEPKLNTKMRKPDPIPGTEAPPPPPRRKRSSAAAVMSASSQKSSSAAIDDAEKRRTPPNEDEDDDPVPLPPPLPQQQQQQQPVLPPLRGVNGSHINLDDDDDDDFEIQTTTTRPGSAAAMYSPAPPPTRTTGSSTSSSSSSSSSSMMSTTTPSTSSSSSFNANGVIIVKRPKSRPQLVPSEDSDSEDDGADADAEFIGGAATSSSSSRSAGAGAGWGSNVNVESGRRKLPKRSAATAAVAALEDIRRHSMAF